MTSTLLIAPRRVERTPAPPAPRLRRMPYEPQPGPLRAPRPRPTPAPQRSPTDVPGLERPAGPDAAECREAHQAAARLLRTALEVFDGRRPLAHLADQVAPPVLRYWRVATQQRRVREPARFTRMRLCLPRRGIAEAAVTCHVDGRPRALAARFERGPRAWRCTALRLG